MNEEKKLSFRPGPLWGPLQAWCEKHHKTPSDAIRIALAKMLKEEVPDMQPGNPEASRDTAIAANAARWKPKRKQRKKRSSEQDERQQ